MLVFIAIFGRAIDIWGETQKRESIFNKINKEIKTDNFCYCEVGRAITKWGAKVKFNIDIAILDK